MSDYIVESFDHNGCLVTIYPDDLNESPREWCNLGEMVCWHRGYDLGDRQPNDREKDALGRGGLPLLERYLRLCEGATVVIPLGLLDHSGISMYAGGGAHWSDAAGWDSGTVGFIFDTPYGREQCGTPLELVEECLRQEIKVFDQYLTGDVYFYAVERGDQYDSCGGLYGLDYAIAEAKTAADYINRAYLVNIEPPDMAEILGGA